MEKSSDALRTISEVSSELDIPKHVLRFWESKFTQIKPMKRGGGRRYYRPADILLLRGIRHLLYTEGFTIRGVQQIFKREGVDYVKTIAQSEVSDAGADRGLENSNLPLKTKPATTKKAPAPSTNAGRSILTELMAEINICREILAGSTNPVK